MPKNDWNSYKELFLHEMQENSKHFNHVALALEALSSDIATMKLDIGSLKIKAAIVGGVAGLLGTGIISAAIRLWK